MRISALLIRDKTNIFSNLTLRFRIIIQIQQKHNYRQACKLHGVNERTRRQKQTKKLQNICSWHKTKFFNYEHSYVHVDPLNICNNNNRN